MTKRREPQAGEAVGPRLDAPVGWLVPERVKRWRVVRYVREEFEIEAASRAEALANVDDPHTVVVTHETCVRAR